MVLAIISVVVLIGLALYFKKKKKESKGGQGGTDYEEPTDPNYPMQK